MSKFSLWNIVIGFVSSLFAVRTRMACRSSRSVTNLASVEIQLLEERALLTPQLVIQNLPNQTFQAANAATHDVTVNLSKFRLSKAWTTIDEVHMPVSGTSTNALSSVSIVADLYGANGRPGRDGVYETTMATDSDLTDGFADLDFQDGLSSRLFTRRVPTFVIGHLSAGATTGTVGLGDPFVIPVDDNLFFTVTGAQNPVHTVQGVPIPSPSLYMKPDTMAAADTAVSNQQNINLLRFSGLSSLGNSLLSDIQIGLSQGSWGDTQNYSLWADTDNNGVMDTELQQGVSMQNGILDFDNLTGGGYTLLSDHPGLFEVHGDVVPVVSASSIQLRLNAVTAENPATGATLLGQHLAVDITTGGTLWSFVNQGNVTVTRDVLPPAHQVLAGALSDELFRFTIAANLESADVFKLQFTATGTGANSIDRFNVYMLGATTPFAVATIAQTGSDPVPSFGATYTASMTNQQLVIDEGTEQTIIVKALLKSDDQGAVPGQVFQVTVTPATGVQARGITSSNLFTAEPDTLINSPQETVVGSKIISMSNADPDANNTNVPTGISPLGMFTFTAAQNINIQNGLDKVILDTLVFDVALVNVSVDPSSYYLYRLSNASTKVAATSVVATATGVRVTFSNLSQSAIDTRDSSGASLTVALQGNITNSKIGTAVSHLQVSMDTSLIQWIDADINRTTFTGFDLLDKVFTSTLYTS